MPMMAITTSNSIYVKPERFILDISFDLLNTSWRIIPIPRASFYL